MAERRKAGTKKAAPGRDGSGEPAKNEFLPPRPISLRTLGDYLDLSPATISLVLNNAPGVRSIPQETRDRVIAAAKKFEYRPSFFARSLRRRQSFSVGVLVPELSDGYSVLVMSGIEEVLIEEGYFYLTASHRRKADLIEEYPGLLMDRSVEGFVAIDTALQHSLPLPVVAVAAHKPLPGVTRIVLDHSRAADLMLRHLYQLGHRQIAFMRGQTFSSDSDDRWKSLMAVAKELGIEVLPELVVQLEQNLSSPELGYPVVPQAAGVEEAVHGTGFVQRHCRHWSDPLAARLRVARARRCVGDRLRRYPGSGVSHAQPDHDPAAAQQHGEYRGAHPAAENPRVEGLSRTSAHRAGADYPGIDAAAESDANEKEIRLAASHQLPATGHQPYGAPEQPRSSIFPSVFWVCGVRHRHCAARTAAAADGRALGTARCAVGRVFRR